MVCESPTGSGLAAALRDERLCIVMTGPPAAGKTTLAIRLSKALAMPVLSKDEIKEGLADVYGWGTVDESRRQSQAAFRVLYDVADRMLGGQAAVVLDANFGSPSDPRDLSGLAERWSDATVVQMACRCREDVVLARQRQRAVSALRHPCHLDALSGTIPGYRPELYEGLTVRGAFHVPVDCSDDEDEAFESALSALRQRFA